MRSCAPAESAPSSLVSCWYCAIRRTAVTNSHEIRIVVREMAAITSGRRKQGLSPFLCDTIRRSSSLRRVRSRASLHPPLSLSLPTQNGTKIKCSPFQLLCCTVHGTVLDVANTDSQNLSPLPALAQHSLQAYACSFVACSRRMLTPHAQKLACTMWRTRPHSLARGQAIGSDPRKVGSKSTR